MNAANTATVTAVVVTGLMAGLFFGWMVSVIPGTRLVDDRSYVVTMQQINRSIVNPAFVVPFLGTPILLLAAAVAQRRSGNDRAAVLLAAATGIYVIGLLGVTMGGNVPLNNALDALDLATADGDELHARRTSYEESWNRWHAVRTGAAAVAFGLAATATSIADD